LLGIPSGIESSHFLSWRSFAGPYGLISDAVKSYWDSVSKSSSGLIPPIPSSPTDDSGLFRPPEGTKIGFGCIYKAKFSAKRFTDGSTIAGDFQIHYPVYSPILGYRLGGLNDFNIWEVGGKSVGNGKTSRYNKISLSVYSYNSLTFGTGTYRLSNAAQHSFVLGDRVSYATITGWEKVSCVVGEGDKFKPDDDTTSYHPKPPPPPTGKPPSYPPDIVVPAPDVPPTTPDVPPTYPDLPTFFPPDITSDPPVCPPPVFPLPSPSSPPDFPSSGSLDPPLFPHIPPLPVPLPTGSKPPSSTGVPPLTPTVTPASVPTTPTPILGGPKEITPPTTIVPATPTIPDEPEVTPMSPTYPPEGILVASGDLTGILPPDECDPCIEEVKDKLDELKKMLTPVVSGSTGSTSSPVDLELLFKLLGENRYINALTLGIAMQNQRQLFTNLDVVTLDKLANLVTNDSFNYQDDKGVYVNLGSRAIISPDTLADLALGTENKLKPNEEFRKHNTAIVANSNLYTILSFWFSELFYVVRLLYSHVAKLFTGLRQVHKLFRLGISNVPEDINLSAPFANFVGDTLGSPVISGLGKNIDEALLDDILTDDDLKAANQTNLEIIYDDYVEKIDFIEEDEEASRITSTSPVITLEDTEKPE
jgi:hypothetical protein